MSIRSLKRLGQGMPRVQIGAVLYWLVMVGFAGGAGWLIRPIGGTVIAITAGLGVLIIGQMMAPVYQDAVSWLGQKLRRPRRVRATRGKKSPPEPSSTLPAHRRRNSSSSRP